MCVCVTKALDTDTITFCSIAQGGTGTHRSPFGLIAPQSCGPGFLSPRLSFWQMPEARGALSGSGSCVRTQHDVVYVNTNSWVQF